MTFLVVSSGGLHCGQTPSSNVHLRSVLKISVVGE